MAKAKFETRVKREKKRLDEIFAILPDDRKAVVKGLIENAAFLKVTLDDLQDDIRENGETELFQQGNQMPYLRERPSSKKYDARNQIYQKIIKLLLDELPKNVRAAVGDEFETY